MDSDGANAQKFLGQVRVADQVDDGELRRVGTRKQRSIAKQKIETDCVLVFARREDNQSLQYICGIKSYGQ